MSNVSQYTLSLNITANASQHNATLVDAAQVGKRFGSDVQASAAQASAGLQRVGDAAQKAGAASAQGFNQATMSAKQYQAALRGLPAQFTDIFTSLASGQAPLTVFMQQGGQLKDMFDGAGNAARALGGYVAGMVSPLTATAAAVAVLAAGMYAGSNESHVLQNAIINSGNAAGVTQGQMMGMAAGVDAVVGTQGRAVEVLGAFVATGKVGAANIEAFTTAAIRFESVGGAAAEDTAKSFAELGKSPVEASLKLNDSMGYLTVSTYQQIKALADQGKHTEAAEVAQKAFADTLNSRSGQMEANLGLVEKGWKGIKWAVSEAWDAIKNIGRDAGPEGRLEVLGKKIAQFEANIAARKGEGHDVADREARLAKMREEQALLQNQVGTSQALSAEQARQVQLTKDQAEWDKRGEKYKSDQQKLESAISSERLLSQGLINAGLMTEKQLADRISAIREEYAKKGSKSGASDTELANIVARVAAERQNLDLLKNQGLHYDKLNDGERTALQLTEQLTAKLDAKTRKSKEAQLVQAKILSGVLNEQQVEREFQQSRAAAKALDEKLTAQQIGQYQQSIDQLVTGNEQLRTEIELVGKDAAARREYLALKAQELITAKELEVINLRNAGARQEVINKAEQELRLLRDKLTLTSQVNSAQDGQAAKDMLIAIQRETEALGQSNEQRQVTIALRELEAKGIKEGSAAYDEYIPKIKAAISGKAVAEQSVAFWSSVENVAHDAWNHIGEQGESAADRIKRALKSGVWDMLWQISGRRWLIDIGVSAGVPGAATAASATSGIGSLANGSSMAGSVYGFGSTVATGYSAVAGGADIGAAIAAYSEAGMTGTAFGLGVGEALAAIPGWGWAIAGVAALATIFDDSGTPHAGGAAQWSAATGTQLSNGVDPFGLGFTIADYGQSGSDMAKGFAVGVGGMLDSVATTFGRKAGYSVAAAFADDASKDLSWGGLIIKDDSGKDVVNWNDERTSRWASREFADGKAGAQQYGIAVAKDVRDYLVTQTPLWADDMLNALGDSPTLEQLGAAVMQINATQNALVTLGDAAQSFANLGEAASAALIKSLGGAQSAVNLLGGYYQHFYSDAERKAVTAKQLTASLGELGVTSMPKTVVEYRALVDAANAAGNTDLAAGLIKLSDSFYSIAGDANAAADSITSAADELKAAKEEAQKQQTTALSNLSNAIEAEKALVQVRIDIAQETVSSLTGVFDLLNTSADRLFGHVASAAGMAAARGQAYIDDALATYRSTGYLPNDTDALSSAIDAATAGVGGGTYTSTLEAERAQLMLAHQLKELGVGAEEQLTVAQRTLAVETDALNALDNTLKYWDKQVTLAQGGIDATLTVRDAVNVLADIMDPDKTKRPGGSGGGGGRGGGGGGGGGGFGGIGERPGDTPEERKAHMLKLIMADANASGRTLKNLRWVDTLYNNTGGWDWDDPTDADRAWYDAIKRRATDLYDGSGDSIRRIYDEAGANGVSMSDLAASLGLTPDQLADYLRGAGIPGYAVGANRIPHDQLALVHKDEAIVPAAFNPAAHFGGGTTGAAERMQRLEADNAKLLAALSDGAARQEKLMDRIARAAEKQASMFASATNGGKAMKSNIGQELVSLR